MNLQPFRWSSVAWGLVLAAVMMYIVMPSLAWSLRFAGIAVRRWNGQGTRGSSCLDLESSPRVSLKHAFHRLRLHSAAAVSGSRAAVGAIAVIAASLLHLPYWGPVRYWPTSSLAD
jgi:hypothetical protein